MIQNIRPTSKAALKMQCLYSCGGDIDKAAKLYEFMIKDMENLPMFDVQPPTTMQQIKDGAVQTFAWLNDNQETIMNWVGMIKQMLNKGGGATPTPTANAPIPPINHNKNISKVAVFTPHP